MSRAKYVIKVQHIRRGNPDNVLRELPSLISTTPWDDTDGSANIALGLLGILFDMQEGEAIEILQKNHDDDASDWRHVDGLE